MHYLIDALVYVLLRHAGMLEEDLNHLRLATLRRVVQRALILPADIT